MGWHEHKQNLDMANISCPNINKITWRCMTMQGVCCHPSPGSCLQPCMSVQFSSCAVNKPQAQCCKVFKHSEYLNTTHTRLMALCPGLPGWASTKKEKPIWILRKQETVSGSGFSWAICKSAPCSRQITTPAPHRSVFYRPDALPAAQPTASKYLNTK